MAPPLRIEWLDGREAIDLVQALAVRGLVGKPTRSGERHAVVIHDPHEEIERLLADVVTALETWLADRGRTSLQVRVGERSRTVSPSGGDLRDVLRPRTHRPAGVSDPG